MKKVALLCLLGLWAPVLMAQPAIESKSEYRATPEKINNLVHTKLDARFDFSKSYLNGKAWLTLQPHFYPTDSLLLDAKGMDIKAVAVVKGGKNVPLKYTYNGLELNIDLDKTYKRTEQYTVYIEYVAKPDEFDAKGSAAINDAKGLYFINPRGEEAGKPTQIWTQGETEATSVYVPTIDKPNQKTTQEFILTVPAKYVTLSNGKLASQKTNTDGTRTDHWKMEQPHAPYLFFIGVGEYSVIKDSYKGKEVSYYVEKEWAPVARRIFGNTPEMIKYFGAITGIEYPWVKYAQIVGRDYVSGAMENTTATLHQESVYQDARELTDGNHWENTIAHELFHHWFGDYVTTESWSNLTLNESFANYSEYLWQEYKFGKDAADAHHYDDMQGYIMSGSAGKDLVRFHYGDKEDMFDAVSYNKGGRILHMLRNFIGDSAFYKGMNLFLSQNKYKAAEAHQLRLAFEEVTGKDLNWFFNQWYFGAGHPKFDITYNYNDAQKRTEVIVKQTQEGQTFRIPVAIDVYNGINKKRHNVWLTGKVDTFYFDGPKPELVNFDGDKILLAERKENKTIDNYLHQYRYAGTYIDRLEAIDFAATKQAEIKGVELMTAALTDKYGGLRQRAIEKLDLRREGMKAMAEPILAKLAKEDAVRTTKAAAIAKLGEYGQEKYAPLFKAAIKDSSYTVAGNALQALNNVNQSAAYTEAKAFINTPMKGGLAEAVGIVLIQNGDEAAGDIILTNYESIPFGQKKLDGLEPVIAFLSQTKNLDAFKRGVNAIVKLKADIPEQYKSQINPALDMVLRNIQKAKTGAGQPEMAAYIESQFSPKGF